MAQGITYGAAKTKQNKTHEQTQNPRQLRDNKVDLTQ